MSISNGKRDVLRSLDYILYCHIAYTYFLDASLLVLFFRILLQLQLLSPRALTRSLRTALAIVTAGWLICLLMHLTTEPGKPGIIIDFIGNQQTPSLFRLIILDFTVYILQVVRVLTTSSLSQLLLNGTVVTTLAVPPALAAAIGADNLTLMLPPREESLDGDDSSFGIDDLFHHNELVVDIGLRNSLRNVMYADMEDPNTARDGSEQLPV